MDSVNLSSFYDNLKSEIGQAPPQSVPNGGPLGLGGPATSIIRKPAHVVKHMIADECNQLKDKCKKHLLLDIYVKILPLDDEWKSGNAAAMAADIDAMLANKGVTATQYLKSCSEGTNKAPLLEFVNHACDLIGREFMEETEEKVEEAKEKNLDIPDPKAPEDPTDDENINNQLVDVKEDKEYEHFIDKLKEKTINKIVTDVSKIIADKKEEKNMAFDPKPAAEEALATESVVSISLNYMNKQLLKEDVEITPELQEEMIGMAIREATLNQLDVVFNQPAADLKQFNTRMNLNKGVLISESTVFALMEAVETKDENPTIKEVDGKKYDVSNFSSIDDKGIRRPMNDTDARKVLGPQEYDKFKNKKMTEGIDFFLHDGESEWQEMTESKKGYEKLKKAENSLTPAERTEAKKRFGNNLGCSIGKDDKGYYCFTHRARSKSCESIDKIPMKDYKFICSTS